MIAAEARRMPHRRTTTPAVAVLVLLLGAAVSACGFEPRTDRINTIAAGVNDRSAKVDALGIRVLSSAPGEGRLIGALTNNTAEEAGLTGVAGEGVTTDDFDPITMEAAGHVNLAADQTTPVLLTGDFVAGDVIPLELSFDTGESVALDVPVVKNCGQYTQVPEPTTVPESEQSEAAAAAEEDHGGDATYLCDHPTDDAAH